MAAIYRQGNFGYGQVKKALAEAAESYFAPARERRAKYEADPALVRSILDRGAAHARATARKTLDRAKKNCGLL
jgi:tryptophanyl-tRNA synthetase